MVNYKDKKIKELKRVFEILKDDVHIKWQFYFAAPWFTKKSRIFYDEFKEYMKSFPDVKMYFPKDYQESPDKAFKKNVEEIQKCDAVLAWVDEKDCGTAWEIGYAHALEKPVYLLGYNEETFLNSKTNLMLAKSGKAITLFALKDLLNNCIGVHFIDFGKTWNEVE